MSVCGRGGLSWVSLVRLLGEAAEMENVLQGRHGRARCASRHAAAAAHWHKVHLAWRQRWQVGLFAARQIEMSTWLMGP